MKSAQIIAVFIMLLFSNVNDAQNLDEQKFRDGVHTLFQDAATGFKAGTGEFLKRVGIEWLYDAKINPLEAKNKALSYHKEIYSKYSGKTDPAEFAFSQNFDLTAENGQFLKANAERILDEMAVVMNLSKNVLKQRKSDKDKVKRIEYLDKKSKRRMIFIKSDVDDNSFSINFYSDLKPGDLPNYHGCLLLYKTMSKKIVGATTMYIYGDGFESGEKTYANVMKFYNAAARDMYGVYQYLPNATERVVEEKLDMLGVTYDYLEIKPDGSNLN